MPIGPARMPILDHLGELRRRLLIILVCVFATALLMYAATPTIIDFLLDPIKEYLPNDGKLTVLTALGGFTMRFKVSIFAGVVICTPIIVWEIMAFVLPALTPEERVWVIPTVIALVVLFFLGMAFCYFVAQRAAFGWLLDQAKDFAVVMPTAEDYLHIIMLLLIGFGIAFELPLAIFYLAILHVVPYKKFRQDWRYVYVAIMVISAMVTPDASPITMLLMFLAMIALYEIALLVARFVISTKDGKEALKWDRDDYEAHELEQE